MSYLWLVLRATLAAAPASGAPKDASLEDMAADLKLAEPTAPWDYPSPDMWFAEFRSSEEQLSLVRARWLRARILSTEGAIGAEEVARARVAYDAIHMDLVAQKGLLSAEIEELDMNIVATRGDLTLSSQDPSVRDAARRDLEVRIDDAVARTMQATQTALGQLRSSGSAGVTAARDLEHWRRLREQVEWSLDAGSQDSKLSTRVDDARMAVLISAQNLPDSSRALVMSALNQAESEERLRAELRSQVNRLSNPNDPFQQSYVADHLRDLEQARLERQRTLNDVLDALDGVESELASLAAVVVQTPAEQAFNESRARVLSLRATYDRLYLGMPLLDARINSDAWCKVHLRSAMLRMMLDEDGVDSLLRNAAAAYGGTCDAVASTQLESPAFAAAWAQAALRVNREAPIRLSFDLGPGVWTLDGVPVMGGGPAAILVSSGVHRLEYQEETGRLHHLAERLDPGEQLCVALSSNGDIALDPCAFGLEDGGGRLPPARTPYSGRLDPDFDDESVEVPARTFVSASGQWSRLATSDDDLDLLGARLSAGWRLNPSSRGLLHLGFDQDIFYSDAPLALTNSLTLPLVLQERLTLSVRGAGTHGAGALLQPVGEIGAGLFVAWRRAESPSASSDEKSTTEATQLRMAPPLFIEVDGGMQVHLSDHVSLLSTLGLSQVFWAEPEFEPRPSFRLGIVRWL